MANPRDKKPIQAPHLNFAPAERAFIEAFAGLDDDEPRLLIQAADGVKAVVKAICDRGGKGSVTVKLAFAGEGGKRIVVAGDVKVVTPKPKPRMKHAFGDENGYVVEHDPDQMTLVFKDDKEDANDKTPSATNNAAK